MLELSQIDAYYGRSQALSRISLTVGEGEIVAMIGANGAGKTTTLNAISGLVPTRKGRLLLDGVDIQPIRAAERVRRGIVQVPEGRLVFPDMTVAENLEMGGYTRPTSELPDRMAYIYDLFPRLHERVKQQAGLMSGGEQQMLAIGRALMAKPRFLLLDEPSMGLAPLVISDIFETLRRIRQETKVGILLVEQNARAALQLSDRGYVLAHGGVVTQGKAADLLDQSSVREAFLGKSRAAPLRVMK
jgi:branched-chain amino acid transport system ATP-binding protein